VGWDRTQLFATGGPGIRDLGIDGKLGAELTAWKLQQKPELRQADSLVIATAKGGLITLADAFEPRPDKTQRNGSA
jgi:hypothetical protein